MKGTRTVCAVCTYMYTVHEVPHVYMYVTRINNGSLRHLLLTFTAENLMHELRVYYVTLNCILQNSSLNDSFF